MNNIICLKVWRDGLYNIIVLGCLVVFSTSDDYDNDESNFGTTTTMATTTKMYVEPISFEITHWEKYFTNMTVDGDLMLVVKV